MPHSSGCIIFCQHELVRVGDRKNIACYRERTAITSLNQQRHEQHKKAVIWQEIAGVCRIFSGKYRYSAVPANACNLTDFILQTPDFILQMPDFSAHNN
jgi:hypothetical protein